MKKLFTLAAAILASFSLWAVDPTYESSEWATQADAEAALGAHGNVTLAQSGLSYGNLGSNGSFYYVAAGQNLKASESTWKYFSIVADKNYFIDSVSVWYCENGSNETNVAWIGWGEGETPATKSLAHGETAGTKGSKKLADAKWVTIDAHTYDIQTMYLSRSIREFQDAAGKSISNFGKGQSFNILGFKIWLRKGCEDPEFTVSPTEGTGFVGDPINITVSSKNNSKPVNAAVTVDGVEGVYGTDYTYSASTGLVQATPLKAGKFEITFSQATDGTYCAAEKTVTFEISAKTPCTSFDIDAPATARIGEEVTIELKNFDAAPTTIVWYDGDMNEITAANGKTSYTFTPAAAGDYVFQATAWNAYNTYNVDEAYNYTIITVTVGTDATLSDLKVNGATIDGFAADKYEYNIELGVYEAMAITATATDAPYASAAIVDNGEGKVTITVTAQNESTKEYVVNYNRADATLLAPISTSTTWDWTKAGDVQTSALSETTTPKQSDEINFADVLTNYDASFNAAALVGKVQWYNRQESTNLYTQGNYWKFNTSVPGKLVITYSGTNTTARELRVNEVKVGEYNSNKPQTSGEINITAGEVTIAAYQGEAVSMARIYKLVFTADGATAIDNTEAEVKAVKMVENGMLIIKMDGKKYNIIGSVIR